MADDKDFSGSAEDTGSVQPGIVNRHDSIPLFGQQLTQKQFRAMLFGAMITSVVALIVFAPIARIHPSE